MSVHTMTSSFHWSAAGTILRYSASVSTKQSKCESGSDVDRKKKEEALMGRVDQTLTTLRAAPGKPAWPGSHTLDIIVILKIHVQTTSVPGGTGRAICSTPPSWPPGYHIKIAITVSIPESQHPKVPAAPGNPAAALSWSGWSL